MRKYVSHEKIRLTLLVLMVFIITGLIAIYYIRRMTAEDILINNLNIDSGAVMTLRQMQQTSSRNGIKEWTLTAESARLLKNKEQAVLDGVHVIFFMDNNEKIDLDSRHGRLHTKRHDMTLFQDVIVRNKGATLETDELHYEKKRHIIYSESGVVLKDGNSTIMADTMTIDINHERVTFTGRVNAFFDSSKDVFALKDKK